MSSSEWGEWAADIAQTNYDEEAMSKFLAAHAKFKIVQEELSAKRAAADAAAIAEAARNAEAARQAAEDAAVAWDADGTAQPDRDPAPAPSAGDDRKFLGDQARSDEDEGCSGAGDHDGEEGEFFASVGGSEGGADRGSEPERMFGMEEGVGERNGASVRGAADAVQDTGLRVVEGLGDAGLTGLMSPLRQAGEALPVPQGAGGGQASLRAVGVPLRLGAIEGAVDVSSGQGTAGRAQSGARPSLRVSTGLFGQPTSGNSAGQNGAGGGSNGVPELSAAPPPQAPISK